jgi:hypothetical protein
VSQPGRPQRSRAAAGLERDAVVRLICITA